jgi:WD40 repeat protein
MNRKLFAATITMLLATLMLVVPQHYARLQGGMGPIDVLDFSPQVEKIVTGNTDDGAIRIWNLAGQLLTTVQGPEPSQFIEDLFEITDVAFNSSGTQIAVSFSGPGVIWVLDVNTGQKLLEIQTGGYVGSIDWSPDNSQLVGSTSYGIGDTQANYINVWSATTGTVLNKYRLEGITTADVDWNPNSNKLVFSDYARVVIWDITLWQKVFSLEGHTDVVTSVAWSPDGSRVASTDRSTVRTWDATTGQQLAVFQKNASQAGIPRVAWSPDGSQIASTADSIIEVWNVTTGQKKLTFDEGRYVKRLVWQSDSTLMYGSGYLKTVTPPTSTCDYAVTVHDASETLAAPTEAVTDSSAAATEQPCS